MLGGLLVVFAIADFAVSWMGINLTPFMGGASRFSPLIFGFVGAALMNIEMKMANPNLSPLETREILKRIYD